MGFEYAWLSIGIFCLLFFALPLVALFLMTISKLKERREGARGFEVRVRL